MLGHPASGLSMLTVPLNSHFLEDDPENFMIAWSAGSSGTAISGLDTDLLFLWTLQTL